MKLFCIPIDLYNDNEYNKIRRNNLILIAELFEEYIIKNNIQIKDEFLSEIVISLEKSIYNKIKNKKSKFKHEWNYNFILLYSSYSSKITKNIDTNIKNIDTFLIKNILENKINVNNLVEQKSYKLSPNKTKNIIEKINKQISIKDQDIFSKTCSIFKCKKCDSKKTIIREFQSRSLDEPTTFSLTCVVCDHTWIN